MREIKFRAWDKKNRCWARLLYIEAEGTIIYARDGFVGSEPREDFIAMQYTGLKDKNGKEIYERDIVKEPGMAEIDYSGELYQIEFSEGCFVLTRPHSLVETAWEKRGFPEAWEIVGNIYENPELLEVSK